MNRGIPTEEALTRMRASDPPVSDVVGVPEGQLTQLEAALTLLRSVLEKHAAATMRDAHCPTTAGRELISARHTQSEAEQDLLLDQLGLRLATQSPPRVDTRSAAELSGRPLSPNSEIER